MTSVKILQNIGDVFVTSVKIFQNIGDVFVTSARILQNIGDVFVTSVKQPRSQGPLSSYLEKVPWLRLVTCLCIQIKSAPGVGL